MKYEYLVIVHLLNGRKESLIVGGTSVEDAFGNFTAKLKDTQWLKVIPSVNAPAGDPGTDPKITAFNLAQIAEVDIYINRAKIDTGVGDDDSGEPIPWTKDQP